MACRGGCFISITREQANELGFFFLLRKNTEYLKLLLGYWMSRNIWAQAYSRRCLNLHSGFIYVVKCGSSWGVEGCRADGQLIDQTASHLLIYSDRKSISWVFFSDPSTSSLVPLLPPLATLWSRFSLFLCFWDSSQDICTVEEVLISRMWASAQSPRSVRLLYLYPV